MAEPVDEAVANNAAWCDMMCRAHGLSTSWAPQAWTVASRSPVGYPDAVSLSRQVDPEDLLGRVQGGAGCSVKDSYAELELERWGFQVLFGATWIHRAAGGSAAPLGLDWQEVRTTAELQRWSAGYDLDVFVPELLEVDDLHFFRAETTGACCALHRSGTVVGVSHLLPGAAAPQVVWSDLSALAASVHPGLDLVGYEQGDDLDAALSTGFDPLGPLRVWML